MEENVSFYVWGGGSGPGIEISSKLSQISQMPKIMKKSKHHEIHEKTSHGHDMHLQMSTYFCTFEKYPIFCFATNIFLGKLEKGLEGPSRFYPPR